jgi:hypothetical protein
MNIARVPIRKENGGYRIKNEEKAGRQEKRKLPRHGAIKGRCAEIQNPALKLWNVEQGTSRSRGRRR